MPQEQEPWWKDKSYYEDYSFDGIGVAIPSVEAIVAEATRRGVEQGKREAWEEIYKHCSEEKEQRSKTTVTAKRYRSHLQMLMQGMAVAYSQLAASAHAKLSSLSQSSNEN